MVTRNFEHAEKQAEASTHIPMVLAPRILKHSMFAVQSDEMDEVDSFSPAKSKLQMSPYFPGVET